MEGAHGSRGSGTPHHGGTGDEALRPAMVDTPEKEKKWRSTETLTLGDWVVRGRERKRGLNRSGEEEERSRGVVLPHATAAEVVGAGRNRAATAWATRAPEEVEHGLVLVRVRSEREREWTGSVEPELTRDLIVKF